MDSMMSSLSSGSNPLASTDHPIAADIHDLNIHGRVPIKLDQYSSSYYVWKTYFNHVFREYYLTEHVDGSVDGVVMKAGPEWSTIEATLIRWF
ncbi:Tubby-like F-box protein [Hordeum vulgare]|nr:Tubby-like F-box protein [Hordeum vulgare]